MPGVLAYITTQPMSDSGFLPWYPDPTAPEQQLLWMAVGIVLLALVLARLWRTVRLRALHPGRQSE